MINFNKMFLISISFVILNSVQGLSQFSSIRVSYINDYLQGGQLELSLNRSIKAFPVSFEFGGALTPDLEGYNIKFGSNYYFKVSEIFNFSVGFRTVHSRFMKDYLGNRQMATYFDFPIRADLKMNDRIFLALTFIPTYNTYTLLNDKILSQTSVGFGYNF